MERRVGELKPQELANTAWAHVTVNRCHGKLFVAVVVAADQLLRVLHGQVLANMAWALATVNYRNEKRFTALDRGYSGGAAIERV